MADKTCPICAEQIQAAAVKCRYCQSWLDREPRRLTRSVEQRQLLGVCGGVGELLDVDPTIVRVLWIIAALLGGAGVVAYLAMGVVVPVADR